MQNGIGGLHHVTAIAGDAQRNLDFYAGFLGLRLVKKTVNFDDPTAYHLYYGDALGSPGTILTFFPWAGARRGRRGVGQAVTVSFAVPEASQGFWLGRLASSNMTFERTERFGHPVLAFEDPDGLSLELVAHPEAGDVAPWEDGPVESAHALRGFHSVTLWEEEIDATADLLTNRLGYRSVAEEGGVHRYAAGEGPGGLLDLRRAEGFWPGASGAGTVHHVAFRAADDGAQLALRRKLVEDGLRPTPVIDRQYFHSVYFREPGGVLFEIATDPPGFTADEAPDALGTALKLPPQYEGMRSGLEAALPPLQEPGTGLTSISEEPELGFVHRWLPQKDARTTLLTLHGTGGDENDLVALGRMLAPDASILSPRGRVLEHGMPRFFRRLAEGVFDEADLKSRAGKLADFVQEAAEVYGFDPQNVFAVGYSNGANIASATMLLHPGVLRGGVLLRPMVPFELDTLPDLSDVPIFLGAGTRDPIVPTNNVERLATMLEAAGAAVTLHWEDAGHGLTDGELREAGSWLRGLEGVKM